MPPGTPKDRVDFLKEYFDKMMNDKGFKALAKKQWRIWSEPMTGEAYAKTIKAVLSSSAEIVPELEAKINAMAK